MERINNEEKRKNRVNDSNGTPSHSRIHENYNRSEINPNSDGGRRPIEPNKKK